MRIPNIASSTQDSHFKIHKGHLRNNIKSFLRNVTLQLHIKKYEMEDPSFVNKCLHSIYIYVDDVAFGGDSKNEVFELYLKTKSRLAEGGINLRKFVSNDRG